jgi:hypothetical protein
MSVSELRIQVRASMSGPGSPPEPGPFVCWATKSFWHRREVNVKPTSIKLDAWISAGVWELGSMVEVIVILSVLSAGIFLAHAMST